MRNLRCMGLAYLASVAASGPAFAQDAQAPETAACPPAVRDIATCYTANLPTGAYLLGLMPPELLEITGVSLPPA